MLIEIRDILDNVLAAVDDSGYFPLVITAVISFQIGKRAIQEYPQLRDTGFAAGLLSFGSYFVWTYFRIGVPVDADLAHTSTKAVLFSTIMSGVAWMALAFFSFLYRSGPGSALKTLLRHRNL